MKRILCFLLLMILVLMISTACTVFPKNENLSNTIMPETTNKESTPVVKESGTNISQNLQQALESVHNSGVTPEMIGLFYDYYSDYYNTFTDDFIPHDMELRLLPDFKEGSLPQWNELTRYVFSLSKEDSKGEYGEKLISKSTFDQTVKRFFSNFKYTHKSSLFLKLTDDGYYSSVGWDNNGSVYYRLTNIEKNDQNVFTASFEGFYIEEDIFNKNPSDNLKIIREKSYEQGFDGSQITPHEFKEVMRKLILNSNYSKVLTVNETVEIQFELSNNPEYPLRYFSCKRIVFNNATLKKANS